MTPNELVQTGTEIVNQAREHGATIRLCGGVAIYARCPSIESHPKLQREYGDMDFIAPVSAWKVMPDLFISRGFRMKVNSQDRATFTREGLTVDVHGTAYRDYFTFDLGARLAADPLTLPLVDLLLLKLQRVQMAEKDIQDAIALLVDHRVASAARSDRDQQSELTDKYDASVPEGDDEIIDRAYLYKQTNVNWGLWTTVFDNTVMLEKIFDRYLEPEEAQLAWRRIELIQEVMDAQGKSFGWWLRAIPGKRMKWYQEPVKQAEPEPVQVRM
ncbi:MAG: hypothetical protein WCF84_16690 [Anaerolineae bacterium]